MAKRLQLVAGSVFARRLGDLARAILQRLQHAAWECWMCVQVVWCMCGDIPRTYRAQRREERLQRDLERRRQQQAMPKRESNASKLNTEKAEEEEKKKMVEAPAVCFI